ncbi:MAG: hypothetical protein AAF497_00830 [Planctomycetota bacterium]
MFRLGQSKVLFGLLVAFTCPVVSGQTTIYSEAFDGFGFLLDQSLEDFAGETWFANGFATDNGILDTGQFEGSATLPFIPEVGRVYNLSIDVTTDTDRWFGIGFSQNASTSVENRPQDRFAQNGGIAWFLLRPTFGDVAKQVEIFGGPNTDLVIPDDDTDFFGPPALYNMEVVLDTTADLSGSTFQADFLINGNSISNGMQTIDLELSNIANVGFTVEGPDPNIGFGPEVTVDNFLLTVTEEASIDGDFDDNGIYDCLDIDALVGDIASGTNDVSFDLTGDGSVTTDDLASWLLEAGEANIGPGRSYLPGDANLDSVVDVSDFGVWNSNKFTSVAAWCSGDFNADGVVDVSDFGAWNANKFTSSDAAAVPEPDSLWLCIMAGLVSAFVVQRRFD